MSASPKLPRPSGGGRWKAPNSPPQVEAALSRGHKVGDVAKALGVSLRTVQRWRKPWAGDKAKPTRPRAAVAAKLDQLETLLP